MFGLLARTWCVQTFEVPTGSMANAIRGVHRQVTCNDCRWTFDVGSSPDDALSSFEPRAICSNCGADNPLDTLPDQPGDRLVVNRARYWLRSPQRWELAVFQDPERPPRALVKRVVGLPGEWVHIADGNVYINGQIARKSLDEQRAMAVQVHDSAHQPRQPQLPLRWRPISDSSNWRYEHGAFTLSADDAHADADEPYDWLAYQHWRRWPALPQQVAEAPIDDTLGYNQGVPITSSSEVDEILLALHFSAEGAGQLVAHIGVDGDEYRIAVQPNLARATLSRNGQQLHSAPLPPYQADGALMEISTIDRQVLCAWNGRELFPPVHRADRSDPVSPIELAIGGHDVAVTVSRLQLFRDVYYTSPRTAEPLWGIQRPYCLQSDEYFVLGDNSHISHDSRYWADSPAVRSATLMGQPVVIRPCDNRCCLLAWLGL